jgi:purine-binding chemotaxis protein CheW
MTDPQSQIEHDSLDVFGKLRQRIAEMRRQDRTQVTPEVLAKRLEDRATVLRGRAGKDEPVGPQISFLAFRHGSQRYGILVSEIVEILPLSQYTPVPGAPPFIPGVIHWRGLIISLVDLIKLFGIVEKGLIDERTCVIVDTAGRRVGFLTGEVEELYTAPLDQVKPAPEWSIDLPTGWVIGVYDENRLILRTSEIMQDERFANWRTTTN